MYINVILYWNALELLIKHQHQPHFSSTLAALELLTSETKDKDYESIISYLQVLG